MKNRIFVPGIALLLALGGCHHSPTPPGAAAAAPQIGVTQARLVLPAVKGHPGAAYFMLRNSSDAPVTLVHIDVAGTTNTQMHQTSGGAMLPVAQVRLDPGQQVAFTPGGKHVMAFNLAPALAPGGTGTIVFHFQNGKVIAAPLLIEAAAGSDMAGMKM